MPLLKYKCKQCGKVFDELVRTGEPAPKCVCGGETERAYEGKCLGAPKGGCAGDCSCCGGCHHE